jgi:hypothetical protein
MMGSSTVGCESAYAARKPPIAASRNASSFESTACAAPSVNTTRTFWV